MILGFDELQKRLETEKIVENLAQREIENPEGTGYDLRIGKLFKLQGKSYLGVEQRETSDVELVAEYKENETVSYTIKPGEYYLMQTMETVNIPLDLVATFVTRTTLFRSGVALLTAAAHPGYKGELTFGIVNQGNIPFEFEFGARVAHVHFHQITGRSGEYRGQWQGGRVTTGQGNRETQV
ncbi:hypothetical protein ACFL1U_02855 [Patescibacteria group bacterium]